jgi:hypothetical protein
VEATSLSTSAGVSILCVDDSRSDRQQQRLTVQQQRQCPTGAAIVGSRVSRDRSSVRQQRWVTAAALDFKAAAFVRSSDLQLQPTCVVSAYSSCLYVNAWALVLER